ncbi:glycosyltransferase [Geobacter luticola]|uniref:Glycosyltransferase n=1 Tax=Geomobilimonas luticola TaxID=1114878 RepID=A0ABS5SCD2_9BACT|nr:glycosyltransferase [Geomobilimonas luticola]
MAEAIESILSQTLADFEFIIIDDGSTDHSVEIIESYRDSRISLIRNGANLGLSESLNKGFGLARGEYVARMDSDDVSLPERLTRQVAFMEAHAEIGICGTWVEIIGEPAGHVWRYPTAPDVINCMHLFGPALAHPSVMMRREMLAKFGTLYDTSFKRAQDFELWVRASEYTSLANIGEVQLHYRRHDQQVVHKEEQLVFAGKVRLLQLYKLGIIPSPEEFKIHQSISQWRFEVDRGFLENTEKWFSKLIDTNKRVKVFSETTFSEVLCDRWFEVCDALTELGPWTLKKFFLSPLSCKVKLSWRRRVAFFLNCLLFRRRG